MKSRIALAGLLLGTSLLHVARPQTFEESIPDVLSGSRRGWVRGFGAVLAATGLAVAWPRTSRLGAVAAAALFVAVFPANIVMRRKAETATQRRILTARLPLQIPLILWALRVARS